MTYLYELRIMQIFLRCSEVIVIVIVTVMEMDMVMEVAMEIVTVTVTVIVTTKMLKPPKPCFNYAFSPTNSKTKPCKKKVRSP